MCPENDTGTESKVVSIRRRRPTLRGETNLGNIAITEGTNGAVKRMQLVPRVKRGCLQASPVLDDCRDHVTDLACVLVQVDETGATVLPK